MAVTNMHTTHDTPAKDVIVAQLRNDRINNSLNNIPKYEPGSLVWF
jgi:hypothetical protein